MAHYKRGGKRGNVWTVNDLDEMKFFAHEGVDGIITDVPDIGKRSMRDEL